MARITPITYKGPPLEYNPNIGNLNVNPTTTLTSMPTGDGYYDIDYLKDLLSKLAQKLNMMYTQAEGQLQSFSLIINDNDTALMQAQTAVYPTADVPGVITFKEYKYLQVTNNNNATQYIITKYETELRNPPGTNALDISNICSYINNEIKRIGDFIDGYVGEVDDTSEQRTVELFQDWVEDTTIIIDKFWTTLKGKITTSLPKSELDQLTTETAGQLQALFQVKLNKINQNIQELTSQLVKNWEETSDVFYNKHLGPALKFQLKIGRNVASTINPSTMPVLANELTGTLTGINSNFSVALADQIKRNKLCSQALSGILANIIQRDTYFAYLFDLASKGKALPVKFTNSTVDHPSEITDVVSGGIAAVTPNLIDFNDNFIPSHSDLAGVDTADAHPQYLLRSGGSILGDITVAEDVRIDGVIISKHGHTGQDGSVKIHGGDIDYNSITENNIDNSNSSTSVPTNLIYLSQSSTYIPPGLTKAAVKISFDLETSTNVAGYEFEITKLL